MKTIHINPLMAINCNKESHVLQEKLHTIDIDVIMLDIESFLLKVVHLRYAWLTLSP